MSDVETPMPQDTPVETKAEAPKGEAKVATQPGPADDIRMIQALLINGLFPGAVAPQVTKSYSYLDKLAEQIEKEANASK